MRIGLIGWVLLAGGLLSSGCNWLTPLIFVGEHKRAVAPEFDKLAHSRVAVVVWADQSTLFAYPYARLELATFVGDKLYAEMAQRSLDTEVVDPRDVDDYLQHDPEAAIDPAAVGKHFDADYVVYLEILEFQLRDPQQPQLLRGKISAAVAIHDIRSDPDAAEVFELAPVDCVHPENAPVMLSRTNSRPIREATYMKFSELVARKFYEYKEDL